MHTRFSSDTKASPEHDKAATSCIVIHISAVSESASYTMLALNSSIIQMIVELIYQMNLNSEFHL